MNRTPIIGVMGGGVSSSENSHAAYRLGGLIAEAGWILLNGLQGDIRQAMINDPAHAAGNLSAFGGLDGSDLNASRGGE